MSLKELSNTQIDRYFASTPSYAGCHPKDKLPSVNNLQGKFCFVNLESSTKGSGTHWTLLFNVYLNQITYFDSMGMPPPTSVKHIMDATRKRQTYNTHDFQPLDTSSCGWWCIYAAKTLLQGHSLQSMQDHFSGSVGHSEELLRAHFSNNPL